MLWRRLLIWWKKFSKYGINAINNLFQTFRAWSTEDIAVSSRACIYISVLVEDIVFSITLLSVNKSSHLEVFLVEVFLKIYSKFTRENPCWCVTSIKLPCNFIDLTPRQWCSPANLLHIFRISFRKNISGEPPLRFFFNKTES